MVVKKKERLMSIDPSINNVGIAIWELPNGLMMHRLLHPKVNARDNEFDKSLSIVDQIKEWMKVYAINRMILEVPAHWAVKGYEARESGSIAKLCVVVGMIYSLKHELDELRVVKPHEWKGQLSKEVMVNRLQPAYEAIDIDLGALNPNVADAIGIGHFYITGRV